jgi:hypothetical protein
VRLTAHINLNGSGERPARVATLPRRYAEGPQ